MSLFVEKTAISLVTGAMGSLLPKLAELMKEEYKLKKSVQEGINALEKEMKSMHAALHKVAEVPRDQLDEQIMLWAGEVRELSFDMEDIVDKFLVHVDDDSEPAAKSNKLKRLTEKMAGLFTKGKARHEIADAIKDINKQVQEVVDRRGRYTVDSIVSRPTSLTTIDPRLVALYTEVIDLVGISGKRDQELIKLLSGEGNISREKLKIVSVVGFGGLGKTTLVKTVYDKIKGDFDCVAFVPVGRNADAKKFFMDTLVDLGIDGSQLMNLDERQLINKLRESLENKRYLIVIDDIWDKSLWRVIKCAFSSKNKFGSRLITTTRILNVATFCCSSSDDSVYQMEPLSDDESRRLFYNRIFSHDSGCPHEFEEVSINILNKCGGVPLAIITIASLLAGDQGVKHVDEWYSLLGSIGRGLTEDPCVEEMLRILSLSYDDLPSHLKTCLLYLSMFPEDRVISKDRLIWIWIAESFVHCGKAGTSLFEIGETYFNELANRNMIELVYSKVYQLDTVVIACRVHDMILDLILLLSREDNFVTILNGISGSMLSGSKSRRLSLQNTRKEELQTTPLESVSMLQVRSVVAFEPAIDLMPQLSKFVVLRVLDLAECNIGDHDHLNLRELGSLFHLRYLSLANTGISELPEEVGKLQFLQVLDLSRNYEMQLPSTIVKLRRLMCLVIDYDHKRLPDGLGNLTSMEVLGDIHCDSLSIVEELGNMGRLKTLQVVIDEMSLELEEAIAVSLGKLSNIQCLRIYAPCSFHQLMMDLFGERWVPPPTLREFHVEKDIHFSTLPAWIKRNPSRLSQLSKIHLYVEEVRNEDLEFLGRLPALRNFFLDSDRQSELLRIGADGFRCLTTFILWSTSPSHIMFCPGALPKGEYVYVHIGLRFTKTEAAGNGGDCFDLGMENLRSLRKVYVVLRRSEVTVTEAVQAATELKNAVSSHPNLPEVQVCLDHSGTESILGRDVRRGAISQAT